jgi:hypothetical protein
MKRFTTIALLLLAAGFAVQAQTAWPAEFEVGYRWLDLKGSSDMYRTQINEKNGFLIRSLTMATQTGTLDRLRVDVSDFGIGPAGALRLEAVRTGTYRFRLGYRKTDAFSALPGFANPLLAQGIVPGQHAFDRSRQMVDLDLELMPDHAIVPFIGYSYNDEHGPGQTTYHFGQDEFLLSQKLNDRDRELRAGASFRFASISGSLTQGWRRFRGSETLTLAPGANGGNNPGTVIGQPVTADTITRTDKTNVKTPFTNFYVTGDVMKRVRLVGNYVRFAADGDGSESEAAAGSFASFAISRFFTGFSESATSSAKNTTWRGGGRAEVNLIPNVDFLAGYQREHRDLDGVALVNSVFLNSTLFSGADKKDLTTILNATSSVSRDEDVINAGIAARAIGPFAFRGEYRESKQDLTVSPDLSEIVVPGAQSGTFNRRVRTYDANGTYTHSGLMLGASWRQDRANVPVFRTDFLDRDRMRLRAAWKTPKDFFRIGTTVERMNQDNDRSDIAYDAHIRQISADAELMPLAGLTLRGSISQFRSDSDILIRHPENFTIDHSIQRENGKSQEGGINFFHAPFSIDASMARFENRGTLPFLVKRQHFRATYDFKAHTGIAAEWDRDKYDEPNPQFGYFDASRFGVYLRWRP